MKLEDLRVGAQTYLEISAPFNAKTGNGRQKYKIVGITTIPNISTYHPYEVIYKPFSLPLAVYESHLDAEVRIFEIESCIGAVFRIPEPALKAYDFTEIFEYISKSIVLPLGLQELDVDHEPLLEALTDTILKFTGIHSGVTVLPVSNAVGITSTEKTVIENARVANPPESNISIIEDLTNQVQTLTDRNIALEQHILSCSECS